MPASSANAVPTQKQQFNVYTMMLILSFFAIVTGCVLLWMELETYRRDPNNPDAQTKAWPPWDASAARFTPPPGAN